MRSSKEANRRLYAVAEAQAGMFTTKQAQNAGFSASSQTYHAREGNWVREHRGIYRLMSIPTAERPELVRWHLWSMDRQGRAQGVYSHSTAFGLYEMPETRPPVLHMTVPTGFRRNSATPEGLVLHFADLPESDIEAGEGYRLTGPLRTVLDLAALNTMSREALSEALFRILQRGLITRDQIRQAKIPEASRRQLKEMLGKKR
ncbi:MAG TPA: type IV toxin-antitoxin system AbiEi family antitoxin domain-containing protein [Acidobacteriaceae bacterium]|nr:type IV toxin-antitoxin system AbiEi family antitoxin domain-containing protein [Acidobacteriaceae bacterium]